jgi:DNA-binding response OmpR family regulator
MARILVLGKGEREVSSIAAPLAGMSHFVGRAWDDSSLADAVANGSPELVVLDMRIGQISLAEARQMMETYDQVTEAARFAVVESTSDPELATRYVDDFILYPFEESELAVRLTRLLNRSRHMKSGNLLTADGLVIDTESFEVTVEGRKLALTFKEFELLRYLASHSGRVNTREALLNQVWGYEYFGGLRTVDVHIRRIRAKLGLKHEHLIQTVHGVGYKFVA